MIKFYIRCIILLGVVGMYIFGYKGIDVLYGWNFFKDFSWLHLLWLIWIGDMVQQLVPATGVLSLGSQKQFLKHFVPSNLEKTKNELKQFVADSSFVVLKIAVIWILLVCAVHLCIARGILQAKHVLLIMATFYVCDIICVLFWCPFRVFFMKNRCCATCRIFNWDHIMMFSPGVFCFGFYTWSLFLLSVAVFLVWEIYFFTHPERFWEQTNDALKCSNCTEFLCGRNMHAVGMTNVEEVVGKKAGEIKDELAEKVGETAGNLKDGIYEKKDVIVEKAQETVENIKEEIVEKIDEIKKK